VNREPDPDGGSELGEGPDEGSDEFEAIVAGWRTEGDVPNWPAEPSDAGPAETPAPAPPPTPAVAPVESADEDEHFVPPEPPPLPRIGPPAAVGLVLIVLGIVLVATPGWIGVPGLYGVPLGLVSIASGLGWLVLRLWPEYSADDRDDDDDGAIL
jgi:hypothetical protein